MPHIHPGVAPSRCLEDQPSSFTRSFSSCFLVVTCCRKCILNSVRHPDVRAGRTYWCALYISVLDWLRKKKSDNIIINGLFFLNSFNIHSVFKSCRSLSESIPNPTNRSESYSLQSSSSCSMFCFSSCSISSRGKNSSYILRSLNLLNSQDVWMKIILILSVWRVYMYMGFILTSLLLIHIYFSLCVMWSWFACVPSCKILLQISESVENYPFFSIFGMSLDRRMMHIWHVSHSLIETFG